MPDVTLHRILYGSIEQARAHAHRLALSAGFELASVKLEACPMPPQVERWRVEIKGPRDA